MDIYDIWKPLAIVCLALLFVFPKKDSIFGGFALGLFFVIAGIARNANNGVPLLVFLTLEAPLTNRGTIFLVGGYVIIVGCLFRAIYRKLSTKRRYNRQ